MHNSIQKTDVELIKHICKLCNKSFLTGRSLGGHMRSHVINSHHHLKMKPMKKLSSFNNDGRSFNDSGYELTKDPKRTPKVEDSCEVETSRSCLVVLDKLCKECGKGFQSWKALFGHMKCHSKKASHNSLNQDCWTSQSDDENSGAKTGRIKRSRSRNTMIKRYIVTSTTVTTTTITTASSSVSMNANNSNQVSCNHAEDQDQDQESEIAMCLMMLSRDEGRWGNESESSDFCNSSAFVRLTKVEGEVEGKKPIRDGSKIKNLVKPHVGVEYLDTPEVVGSEILTQNDDESELGFGKSADSSKRKFECTTCNKSFHSYQALGGHKTSHKKLKESLDLKTEGGPKPSDNHQTTVISHECPVCLKTFSSGQALGGHRRSHTIAEANLNQYTIFLRINQCHDLSTIINALLNY